MENENDDKIRKKWKRFKTLIAFLAMNCLYVLAWYALTFGLNWVCDFISNLDSSISEPLQYRLEFLKGFFYWVGLIMVIVITSIDLIENIRGIVNTRWAKENIPKNLNDGQEEADILILDDQHTQEKKEQIIEIKKDSRKI